MKKVVIAFVVAWLLDYTITAVFVSPNIPAKYHYHNGDNR